MEYWPWATRAERRPGGRRRGAADRRPGKTPSPPAVADTGADAPAPTHRHGARSVTQLEILPRPVDGRPEANPWPTYPMSYKVTSAHEEGGDRVYAVNTECFLGDDDGNVRALRLHEVEMHDGRFEKVEGTDREIPAAARAARHGLPRPGAGRSARAAAGRARPRTNVARDDRFATNVDGVFVAGDMGRGQSLIVWAIAEGRSAAAEVDRYLMGDTALPASSTRPPRTAVVVSRPGGRRGSG